MSGGKCPVMRQDGPASAAVVEWRRYGSGHKATYSQQLCHHAPSLQQPAAAYPEGQEERPQHVHKNKETFGRYQNLGELVFYV